MKSRCILCICIQELQSRTKVLGEYCVLNSENFQMVDCDSLDFLKDVHSWKWCWACGKRCLLIGLGVSLIVYVDERVRS